jgi:hypothetical protein
MTTEVSDRRKWFKIFLWFGLIGLVETGSRPFMPFPDLDIGVIGMALLYTLGPAIAVIVSTIFGLLTIPALIFAYLKRNKTKEQVEKPL